MRCSFAFFEINDQNMFITILTERASTIFWSRTGTAERARMLTILPAAFVTPDRGVPHDFGSLYSE
jgi:hypothetical protein